MNKFLWPVRVYYEDTDCGGVVYHSKYLNYMERARTEWLRSKGYELDQLHSQQDIMFVVRSLQIEFNRPAKFNQLLEISLSLVNIGKASMVLEQHIETMSEQAEARSQTNELLVSAKVKIACVGATSFRPAPIPADILKEIISV